eukprot:UN22122
MRVFRNMFIFIQLFSTKLFNPIKLIILMSKNIRQSSQTTYNKFIRLLSRRL